MGAQIHTPDGEMTGVSLFAGVGGLDRAMETHGVRVVAAVEIDNAARGVLADRFPNTTLFPDVTKVTADELLAAGFTPDRGIVTAGFPCQDLSVAGRRKGMGEGTRSGLFWHIIRLAAELRPRWLVLENVPGLLSATCPCPGDESCIRAGRSVLCDGELHAVTDGGACVGGCIETHGGVMGAVLGALGELGYGYAYRVLDAQHFGVPQRRRRVVIVGCLGDERRPVEVLLEPESGDRDSAAGGPAGASSAEDLGYGLGVIGEPGGVANTLLARDARGPIPESGIGSLVVDGGCPDVAPTLQAGGNGTGGTRPPGTTVDTAESLIVVETEVVSTLQGGGKRGYRIDAESAGGGISSLPRLPSGGGGVDE